MRAKAYHFVFASFILLPLLATSQNNTTKEIWDEARRQAEIRNQWTKAYKEDLERQKWNEKNRTTTNYPVSTKPPVTVMPSLEEEERKKQAQKEFNEAIAKVGEEMRNKLKENLTNSSKNINQQARSAIVFFITNYQNTLQENDFSFDKGYKLSTGEEEFAYIVITPQTTKNVYQQATQISGFKVSQVGWNGRFNTSCCNEYCTIEELGFYNNWYTYTEGWDLNYQSITLLEDAIKKVMFKKRMQSMSYYMRHSNTGVDADYYDGAKIQSGIFFGSTNYTDSLFLMKDEIISDQKRICTIVLIDQSKDRESALGKDYAIYTNEFDLKGSGSKKTIPLTLTTTDLVAACYKKLNERLSNMAKRNPLESTIITDRVEQWKIMNEKVKKEIGGKTSSVENKDDFSDKNVSTKKSQKNPAVKMSIEEKAFYTINGKRYSQKQLADNLRWPGFGGSKTMTYMKVNNKIVKCIRIDLDMYSKDYRQYMSEDDVYYRIDNEAEKIPYEKVTIYKIRQPRFQNITGDYQTTFDMKDFFEKNGNVRSKAWIKKYDFEIIDKLLQYFGYGSIKTK